MRLLLDTHALIWWLSDSAKLSRRVFTLIQRSEVLVSAVSTWEIAIKTTSGKITGLPLLVDIRERLQRAGFREEPITVQQSIRAGLLPLIHRDPFDRLLVAQAQVLGAALVSADAILDRYDIKRIW
jgi:PIN domain nuclease of toxin-antitoxin system